MVYPIERGKKVKNTAKPMAGSGKKYTLKKERRIRSPAGMKKPSIIPMKITWDCSRIRTEDSLIKLRIIEAIKNKMATIT